MIAVLAPFAGMIVDRVGRKPLLLMAMLLYTVCGTLPLWLESLKAIVISRGGIGLAEAGIMTCCTTLMADYYQGGRRERLFALQMVATSLSAAAGHRCLGRISAQSVGRRLTSTDRHDHGRKPVGRCAGGAEFPADWQRSTRPFVAAGIRTGRHRRITHGGGRITSNAVDGRFHQRPGHWPDVANADHPDHGAG
uniref:Major facilitator superfamily (MFS) profile domain-containing protein n=1 Tax=Tanacetum cinerariifolium TaxID=118510 RepID=A0A699Q3D6_TANCI|nr:hypothetical protein [Tanacetum cinerariifolium]